MARMSSILAAWPRSGYLPVVAPTPDPDPTDPPPEGDAAPTPWITLPTDEAVNMLTATNDRLLVTYGGYVGGNKRILSIQGDDVTVGPLAPTEGFFVARTYDGATYLPWVDPTGAWNAAQGYSVSTDGGNTWTSRHVVPAYHLFDIRKYDGDLFMCGSGPDPVSGGETALVVRSRDGGATWEESLRVPSDGMPRFYMLVIAGGRLHAPLLDTVGDAREFRLTSSGGWESVAAVAPSSAAPHLGVIGGDRFYSVGGVFDGQTAVSYSGMRPCWSDASHVYAINVGGGSLDRAALADAAPAWETWHPLDPALAGGVARTATLHDGYVYVGGTKGRIWRYSTA